MLVLTLVNFLTYLLTHASLTYLRRYYKSRAAFLARSGSITAAAATTLFAVLPLLGSQMPALSSFGTIFVIVATVAFIYTMGFFNGLLMIIGPRRTRKDGALGEAGGAQPAKLDSEVDPSSWAAAGEMEGAGVELGAPPHSAVVEHA